MSFKSENARGWLGTILFHLLVALGLFLWKLDISASEPEYIEVSLASLGKRAIISTVHPSTGGSTGSVNAPLAARSKSIDLPSRRFAADEEVIHVPPSTKITADEQPGKIAGRVTETTTGTKEGKAGLGTGRKERFPLPGIGDGPAGAVDQPGTMDAGSNVGKNVSVSMLWSDGGIRRKISGALPEYPAGVKVEAQIKIELVVSPNGGVKSLRPVQKGNTRLEEAAMKETRLWLFEPLGKSSPQRNQTCLVTFNFRLR